MVPSETVRPPASTTAIVCAVASRRDQARPTWRSGGATGSTVPRSGQVPTITSVPASRSRRHALDEVAHRLRRQHPVGHVVDADQDDRDVGLGRQRPVDLTAQVGGLGADDGVRAQVDAAVRDLGERAGEHGTRRLLDPVHAVPRCARVAEHRHLDRRAGTAAAVPAGRVGRRFLARAADGAARDRRLERGAGRRSARRARRRRLRRTPRRRPACVRQRPWSRP